MLTLLLRWFGQSRLYASASTLRPLARWPARDRRARDRKSRSATTRETATDDEPDWSVLSDFLPPVHAGLTGYDDPPLNRVRSATMTTKAIEQEIQHVHDLLSLRDLLADRGV